MRKDVEREIYAAAAASPRKAIEIAIAGAIIASHRQELGMAQPEFADALGVDVRTLRRWEADGAGKLVELAIHGLKMRLRPPAPSSYMPS